MSTLITSHVEAKSEYNRLLEELTQTGKLVQKAEDWAIVELSGQMLTAKIEELPSGTFGVKINDALVVEQGFSIAEILANVAEPTSLVTSHTTDMALGKLADIPVLSALDNLLIKPREQVTSMKLSIEEFLQGVERAAQKLGFEDPAKAYMQCVEFSMAVKKRADELNIPCEIWLAEVTYTKDLGEVKAGEAVGHYFLKIGDLFYDYTARQAFPQSEFPLVSDEPYIDASPDTPPVCHNENEVKFFRALMRELPEHVSANLKDEGMVEGRWGTSASGVLFKCEDQVLLLKRAAWCSDPHTWSIPGGAIPVNGDGEKIDTFQSAVNECKEEIGLVSEIEPQGSAVFRSGDFTYTTFLVEVGSPFTPILNNEHDDFRWFNIPEIPESSDIHPGVIFALQDFEFIEGGKVEADVELEEETSIEDSLPALFARAVLNWEYGKIMEQPVGLVRAKNLTLFRGVKTSTIDFEANEYKHDEWHMWAKTKEVAGIFADPGGYIMKMKYTGPLVDMDLVAKEVRKLYEADKEAYQGLQFSVPEALNVIYEEEKGSVILPPADYTIVDETNRMLTVEVYAKVSAGANGNWNAEASNQNNLWYHLTDNAKFKLDPTYEPEDNAIHINQRTGAGIYLSQSVETWVNGHNYWRPFVAEFEVDPSVKQDKGVHGRYGGEMFVPAASYSKLNLKRVIPIDAYAREEFGSYGWIETEIGTEFDTGEPLNKKEMYPFRGYKYSGLDVREMPSIEVRKLKKALRTVKGSTQSHVKSSVVPPLGTKKTSYEILNYILETQKGSLPKNTDLDERVSKFSLYELKEVELENLDLTYYEVDLKHARTLTPEYIAQHPIVVNEHGLPIDGNHRATRAKALGDETIKAWVPLLSSRTRPDEPRYKFKSKSESTLEDHPDTWIHYSKIPEIKVNPGTLFKDPAGIYLFPSDFTPVGNWTKYPFKFEVQLKQELKVLDLSKITQDEMGKIWKTLFPEEPVKMFTDSEYSSAVDLWWEEMSNRLMTKQGTFNKGFRTLGYDAIFDDIGVIHNSEQQMILLNPTGIDSFRLVENKATGFQEVKDLLNHFSQLGRAYGDITETPKAKKVRTGIEGLFEISSGDKSATWQVHVGNPEKGLGVPHHISLTLYSSSPNIKWSEGRSFGHTFKFSGWRNELPSAEKEFNLAMEKIFRSEDAPVTTSVNTTEEDLEAQGYTFKKEISDNFLLIEVFDEDDEQVAILECAPSKSELDKIYPIHVKVGKKHRRKGIASAMYDIAEKHFGMKFKPGTQTEDGKAFRKAFDKRAQAKVMFEPSPEKPYVEVYRVENNKGEGPYSMSVDYESGHRPWEDPGHGGMTKHPIPHIDGFTQEEFDLLSADKFQKGILFGFKDLNQLHDWFSATELTKLKELGFGIEKRKASTVWEGNKQIMFRPYSEEAVTAGLNVDYHTILLDLYDCASEKDYGFKRTQDLIPKESIYEVHPYQTDFPNGLERIPHTTVLFGLVHEHDLFPIRKYFAEQAPFKFKIGNIKAFRNADKPYDVLVAEVISEELVKHHWWIRDNHENATTFPDYKPHITLGYVKKGSCRELEGPTDWTGAEYLCQLVKFSHKEDFKFDLPLGQNTSPDNDPDTQNEYITSGKDLDLQYLAFINTPREATDKDTVWKETKKSTTSSSHSPLKTGQGSTITTSLSHTLESFLDLEEATTLSKLHEYFQRNSTPEEVQLEAERRLHSQDLQYLEQVGDLPKFDNEGQRTFRVRFKPMEGFSPDNFRISFVATEYEVSSTLLLTFESIGPRQGFYSESIQQVAQVLAHPLEYKATAKMIFDSTPEKKFMDIYRVENADEKGPYTGMDLTDWFDDETGIWYRIPKWAVEPHVPEFGRPPINADKGFTPDEVHYFDDHRRELLFGFKSMEDLKEWFKEEELENLKKLGFKIVKKSAGKVWDSGKQVFFVPYDSLADEDEAAASAHIIEFED